MKQDQIQSHLALSQLILHIIDLKLHEIFQLRGPTLNIQRKKHQDKTQLKN